MSNWKFAESLGRSRLDLLLDAPPFEDIAQSIVKNMRPLCSHVIPCHDADGFSRFVACIVIGRTLFDIFFNSYNGYRGWYYRSPTEGLRMNALLVRLLAPSLIDFQPHEGVTADFSSKSLAAPSAKCWLAEPSLEICPGCQGDWSRPQDNFAEIFNGRWETAPNSRFGRKAPYLKKLKLIGGFVNQAGGQYVAKHKVNRAQEIYDVGWA